MVNIGEISIKYLTILVLTISLQHLAASQMTGQDIDRTWDRIQVFAEQGNVFNSNLAQDLVVKSVVSGLAEMRNEWQKSGCNTRYNSYKLLGTWHPDMLNCKINSTNRRTFSKSADKILVRILLFLRAIIMSK